MADALLHAVRALFDEGCNREDHSVLLAAIGSDCTIDDALDPTRRGPFAVIDLINAYKMFVPGLRFEIESSLAQHPRVMAFWSANGRHEGLAAGVRPSGRRIRLRGSFTARVSTGGRLRGAHGSWDVAHFMRDVGVDEQTFARLLDPPLDTVPLRSVQRRGGVPILLFPTLTLPGWLTWRRIMGPLQRTHPVVTFQLIGNRAALRRQPPDRTYGVEVETRAAKRAIAAAGVPGPCHVVGHSAGGGLALHFALEYPELVQTLTLIEPGAAWTLREAGRMSAELNRYLELRRRACASRMTAARYARFVRDTLLDKGLDIRRAPYWPLLYAYRENVRFRPVFHAHADDLSRVRQAPYPVLLVGGRESNAFHREIIGVLAEAFPWASVITMPGGHAPHAGPGAGAFLRHFRRFLRVHSWGVAGAEARDRSKRVRPIYGHVRAGPA